VLIIKSLQRIILMYNDINIFIILINLFSIYRLNDPIIISIIKLFIKSVNIFYVLYIIFNII